MQSNLKNARRWLALLLFVALLFLVAGAAVLGAMPRSAAAAPAAQVGGMAARSVTLYGPTAVTTGTTFSAAPLNVNGIDNARITNYAQADVFVWTDAGSSGTVTVTVQASPDEVNWVNLTAVVHSFNTTGTLTSTSYIQRVVLAGASGAGLVRVPLAGEFLRVRLDVAGAVTPTVKATLR